MYIPLSESNLWGTLWPFLSCRAEWSLSGAPTRNSTPFSTALQRHALHPTAQLRQCIFFYVRAGTCPRGASLSACAVALALQLRHPPRRKKQPAPTPPTRGKGGLRLFPNFVLEGRRKGRAGLKLKIQLWRTIAKSPQVSLRFFGFGFSSVPVINTEHRGFLI
jgi:hypothetical protein